MKAALKYNRVMFSKAGAIFGCMVVFWLFGIIALTLMVAVPNSHVNPPKGIELLLLLASVFIACTVGRHNTAMLSLSFNRTLPFFTKRVVNSNMLLFAIFYLVPATLLLMLDANKLAVALLITATFFLCVWLSRYGNNLATVIGLFFIVGGLTLTQGEWHLSKNTLVFGQQTEAFFLLILNGLFAAAYLASIGSSDDTIDEPSEYKLTLQEQMSRIFKMNVVEKFLRDKFFVAYQALALNRTDKVALAINGLEGKPYYESIGYRYMFVLLGILFGNSNPGGQAVVMLFMFGGVFFEAERYLLNKTAHGQLWLRLATVNRSHLQLKLLAVMAKSFVFHMVGIAVCMALVSLFIEINNIHQVLVKFYITIVFMSLVHILMALMLATMQKDTGSARWIARGITIVSGFIFLLNVFSESAAFFNIVLPFVITAIFISFIARNWLKRDIEFA